MVRLYYPTNLSAWSFVVMEMNASYFHLFDFSPLFYGFLDGLLFCSVWCASNFVSVVSTIIRKSGGWWVSIVTEKREKVQNSLSLPSSPN